MSERFALIIFFFASPAAAVLTVQPHRPRAETWQRTACGGPSGNASIPSKWAKDISASKAPLPEYPRPSLVRGSTDRDLGNPNTWSSLNGLWEWEPAADAAPPFGRPLNGARLLPSLPSVMARIQPVHSTH